jgi:hypothetical protein
MYSLSSAIKKCEPKKTGLYYVLEARGTSRNQLVSAREFPSSGLLRDWKSIGKARHICEAPILPTSKVLVAGPARRR